MTERSRAFLTDLEREAGLPHGTLSERLRPQFAADDPRLDQVDRYLESLAARRVRLTHILDTHTHADHLSGVRRLARRTPER